MTNKTTTYNSISGSSESLFKDRGSKFFGFAFPISSEEDFKAQLDLVKSKHNQARHFCYAWRLDPRSDSYRANDDGEPSHSAGTPILNQIQSKELWNIGVIVVRYFGGTKLGVPGLINAYKQAAFEALEPLDIFETPYTKTLKIESGYEHLSKLMYWFRKYDIKIVEQKLELDCKFTVEISEDYLNEILAELKQENLTFVLSN